MNKKRTQARLADEITTHFSIDLLLIILSTIEQQ